MRRIIVLLAALAALAVVTIPPASAAPHATAAVADGVVGTYTYSEPGGYKVTVGYSPCGHFNDVYQFQDPLATYYLRVTKQKTTVEVWGHGPDDLDGALFSFYGFHLSADAIATLQQDAQTYTCTT